MMLIPWMHSRNAVSTVRHVLVAAIVLAAWPHVIARAQISFSTEGGDAWTFEKLVESAVAPGQCDEVAIASPRAIVTVRPHGDRAIAHVPLGPGDNAITAECHKDGARTGAPAQQHWFVRLADLPKAKVQISIEEEGIALDGMASEQAPTLTGPLASYEWRARDGNPAELTEIPARGQRVLIKPPATDGEYYVTLRVKDGHGRVDESTAIFRVRNGKPETVDVARAPPAWRDEAVVYGVVPGLFGARGLRDVTARLDQLRTLGINTLWLSPVTDAPAGDFGYAVTDHFHLRTDLGRETDLRELIAAAHARSIRVIIDFVPNHLSDQHAYFADAQARQLRSAYFAFFARAVDGNVAHYFDWTNLKNLNYDNPEVRRLVIEAFAYWVRTFDVDGFRVDVAWGPRERAPDFWPHWRAELKRIKPDLLLLAEASSLDDYYVNHGFDAAYDWTEKLGEWAWASAFEDEAHTASKLRSAIAASTTGAAAFRFLNNNDTGPRFISRYGLGRTRVAAAMLLTLPGLPGLYTGDEVGAAYEPYRNLQPINWEDPYALRPWYQRLIELRRVHPALRSSDIRLLDVGQPDQVLAYLRPGEDAVGGILVLLNYGSQPARVSLPRNVLRAVTADRAVDLLSGDELNISGETSDLVLPGHGVFLLKSSPEARL